MLPKKRGAQRASMDARVSMDARARDAMEAETLYGIVLLGRMAETPEAYVRALEKLKTQHEQVEARLLMKNVLGDQGAGGNGEAGKARAPEQPEETRLDMTRSSSETSVTSEELVGPKSARGRRPKHLLRTVDYGLFVLSMVLIVALIVLSLLGELSSQLLLGLASSAAALYLLSIVAFCLRRHCDEDQANL